VVSLIGCTLEEIMDAEQIKLATFQLRLEAVRESVQRARYAFIVATVASLLIIIAAWNAYLSSRTRPAAPTRWTRRRSRWWPSG
jgi:hypothetical protein